jgi:hypothetical protein
VGGELSYILLKTGYSDCGEHSDRVVTMLYKTESLRLWNLSIIRYTKPRKHNVFETGSVSFYCVGSLERVFEVNSF